MNVPLRTIFYNVLHNCRGKECESFVAAESSNLQAKLYGKKVWALLAAKSSYLHAKFNRNWVWTFLAPEFQIRMHKSTGRECERSCRRLFKGAIELSKEEGALTLPIAEALHLGNSEWKTFLAADSLATTNSVRSKNLCCDTFRVCNSFTDKVFGNDEWGQLNDVVLRKYSLC